jgi:hypothetical protein
MLERVRNPRAGRELAGWLRDGGAPRVDVYADALVLREPSATPLLLDVEDSDYMTAARADAAGGRFTGLLVLVTALART